MNAPPAMSMALPRPRRVLWIVMVAMTVLGIFTAFLSTCVTGGTLVFDLLGCDLARAFTQPWRLLTSGLLTDPEHWTHLALSLLGLYFLGAPLEQRWGSWRFARFLALSVVIGNLSVIAVSLAIPAASQPRFHPAFVFGPTAVIAAIAIAWSREYASSTVNLMFFLPVRDRVLFW
ncbi:MAG: rhomboid family intramembrane serine protease, partial [Polyangiaceae bacterium]